MEIVVVLLCVGIISLCVPFSIVAKQRDEAWHQVDKLRDEVVVANAKLAAAERGFRNALKRGMQ